jgi:adenylate cyclase
MEPRELKMRLNHYFEFLFQPIRERGGTISDIVGDSMLAFWENNPCPVRTRVQACHAAMDIQRQIGAAGGVDYESNKLPTRIGLHAGEIFIGNVGAGDHFEYRAVGDTVNTASRIEGLNKHLGTRVLLSAEVANILEGVNLRRVGNFRLKGKNDPLEIFELVCDRHECGKKILRLRGYFQEGLRQYEAGRWHEARLKFRSILDKHGEDGPTLFYLQLCEHYFRHGGPDPWDGVHVLKEK